MQHQSGNGAEGTQDPRDLPWAMGSYICGLTHMNTSERMSLERTWKEEVRRMETRGQDDSYLWIMAGRHVVGMYNNDIISNDEKIQFVPMVNADVIN